MIILFLIYRLKELQIILMHWKLIFILRQIHDTFKLKMDLHLKLFKTQIFKLSIFLFNKYKYLSIVMQQHRFSKC